VRTTPKEALFTKLLDKYEPVDIQNAIVKVFLDKNIKVFRTQNKLLLESQDRAKEVLTREIENTLGADLASPDLKIVENIFEHLFGEKEKLEGGIQYTPNFIIKYIVNYTIKNDAYICDPSCGSGGFLIEAAKRLREVTGRTISEIIESRIFGCDISAQAVFRAKILLSLLCAIEKCDRTDLKFNLLCANSLLLDWRKCFQEVFSRGGFDVVLGNPPYVKIQNMDADSREERNGPQLEEEATISTYRLFSLVPS